VRGLCGAGVTLGRADAEKDKTSLLMTGSDDRLSAISIVFSLSSLQFAARISHSGRCAGEVTPLLLADMAAGGPAAVSSRCLSAGAQLRRWWWCYVCERVVKCANDTAAVKLTCAAQSG